MATAVAELATGAGRGSAPAMGLQLACAAGGEAFALLRRALLALDPAAAPAAAAALVRGACLQSWAGRASGGKTEILEGIAAGDVVRSSRP